MSKQTVEALTDAGLHGLLVPKEVGGSETPIVESIDAMAEISRADGSAGWCLMANVATIAFFGAWAGDDFARELFANGVPLAAGQFAPNGTAEPDGNGFRITGNYNFGSGVNHSDWIGAGVLTTEEESRLSDGARPAVGGDDEGRLGRARSRSHRQLGLLDHRHLDPGRCDLRLLRPGATSRWAACISWACSV